MGKFPSQSLTQTLLMRVVELEDENRNLRSEVAGLQANFAAANSKNQLFKAKLLELQARLEGGGIMNVAGMRSAKSEPKKFRSPLVPKADGTLGYRFERSIPIPPRPSTARSRGPEHPPPSSQPHSARSAPTPRSYRVRSGPTLPVAAASANPNAVDRVYREHERTRNGANGGSNAAGTNGSGQSQGKRGASAYGNGSNHGALQEGEERSGFEELMTEVKAGHVGPSTKLTLQIVYCVDAANKAMTVRHNPHKYTESAEQLKQAAEVTFADWDLQVRCRRD